jgi:adenine-specific DNA-methyltransferase
VSQISYKTTTGRGGDLLDNNLDYLLWYARNPAHVKYRQLQTQRSDLAFSYLADPAGVGQKFNRLASESPQGWMPYNLDNFTSQGESEGGSDALELYGRKVLCPEGRHWRVVNGRERLVRANRLELYGSQIRCRVCAIDQSGSSIGNLWTDVLIGSFVSQKIYVVQTSQTVIERCILMSTDPGDLVLDPT